MQYEYDSDIITGPTIMRRKQKKFFGLNLSLKILSVEIWSVEFNTVSCMRKKKQDLITDCTAYQMCVVYLCVSLL